MKKYKILLIMAVFIIMLGYRGSRSIAYATTVDATSANNPDLCMTYQIINDWGTGFTANVTISNSGAIQVDDWSLIFDFAAPISPIWSAVIAEHVDDNYTIAPVAATQIVPAGGSVTFGYNVSSSTERVITNVILTDLSAPGVPPITVTTQPAYTGHGPSLTDSYNYGEAMQKAWYFYEAQRSGPLPKFDGDLPFFDPDTGVQLHNGFLANRIPWRGDSDLIDGADVGIDLTGGWHDAGDHVKFGMPMAFSASFLAWGVLEFEDALQVSGQLEVAKDNLRWAGDYFIKAHTAPNELYGQVGQGSIDHSIWGPPEVMPHVRPAWKIDMNNPGPDLAAQTSAAMTAISMVFRSSEPAYADVLLSHAIELYDFAQVTRADEAVDSSLGRYSDSITDAQYYYPSSSGAKDDLPFAAAWLYIATKDTRFLHDAEADYTRIADREGHHEWTAVWDDVRYGVYVLMSKIYSDPDYAVDTLITSAERHDGYFDYNLHAQNFLNHWLSDTGVTRTPGGMAWLSGWGSARYNTMTSLLALVYRKHLETQGIAPELQDNYLKFATEQVNYVLGDNPLAMSFMVGFGSNWTYAAHHRASHGSTTNNIDNPTIPRHVLYGALAGGPSASDTYTEDRSLFAMTEVGCDMNAGFTGALAGLVDAYGTVGNETDPNFPQACPPVDEIFAKATLKAQQPTDLATGIIVQVINESAFPPRQSDGLKFKYFIDLEEIFALGFTLDDIIVDVYQNNGTMDVTLNRFGDSAYIFYIEGSFEGVNISPIGTVEKKKTIEFLVRLPWGSTGWDATNDPSYADLIANTAVVTDKITIYDVNLPEGEQLIWGTEPDPGILQSELPPPGEDPPPPATTFEVTPNVYTQWSTGYCVKFTVTNVGDVAMLPAGIRMILPVSVTITNSWNGTITRTGDDMDVALPPWEGPLEPGASRTEFGFCASGTVLPSSITGY